MDKKTADYLNGLPDLEARLGDSLECEMPYYDHTPDTLADTGRNPEEMASETEETETEESWDEPTEEDIDTYRGYYDYRM